MMRRTHSLVLMLALIAAAAEADPVFLSDGDVYFMYHPVQDGHGLCGFQIRGNHMSRSVPRPEWDLNIDELVSGNRRIAGVSAGAFVVTSNDRKVPRKPRAPLTALSFAVQGESQPIAVNIVGRQNAANAVRGIIDAEPAAKLFQAFSTRKLITISLTYQDGTKDVLQVRGWNDQEGSYFAQCFNGRAPFSNMERPVP